MSRIRRRHFLNVSGALLATPFAVGAQSARVGLLHAELAKLDISAVGRRN